MNTNWHTFLSSLDSDSNSLYASFAKSIDRLYLSSNTRLLLFHSFLMRNPRFFFILSNDTQIFFRNFSILSILYISFSSIRSNSHPSFALVENLRLLPITANLLSTIVNKKMDTPHAESIHSRLRVKSF